MIETLLSSSHGITQEILSPEDIFHNDQIHTIMCNVFNRQASKKRYIRANQALSMKNILSKNVIKRSMLRNKYFRQRSNANK